MSRSYTSAKREHTGEPITFNLDGETFACAGDVNPLDIAELARHMSVVLEDDHGNIDPEALAIVSDVFEAALGTQEYRRFRKHVREHRTDFTMQMEILGGIVEDATGRPTERSSESPDGPSITGPISRVDSSPPAEHKVINLQRGEVRVMENLSQRDLRVLDDLGEVSSG